MIFDNQQPQVEMISVTKSFKYSYEGNIVTAIKDIVLQN